MSEPQLLPEAHSFSLAIANHYVDIGQPERALAQLSRAPGEALQTVGFWLVQTRARYALKQYKEAARAATQGLAIAPDSIPLLIYLAGIQRLQGDLSTAERTLLGGLQLDPEHPGLLGEYAMLLAHGNQFEKAARLLDEAIRIAPDSEYVLRQRAILAYLRGDRSEAAREGEALLAANPDDDYGHYLMGHMLSEQGDFVSAARRFQVAARADPSEEAYVTAARMGQFHNHWLIRPLWPLYRFGAVAFWIGAMGLVFILRALGQSQLASWLALAYIVYCLYSWIVPPIVRWSLQRSRVRRGLR